MRAAKLEQLKAELRAPVRVVFDSRLRKRMRMFNLDPRNKDHRRAWAQERARSVRERLLVAIEIEQRRLRLRREAARRWRLKRSKRASRR